MYKGPEVKEDLTNQRQGPELLRPIPSCRELRGLSCQLKMLTDQTCKQNILLFLLPITLCFLFLPSQASCGAIPYLKSSAQHGDRFSELNGCDPPPQGNFPKGHPHVLQPYAKTPQPQDNFMGVAITFVQPTLL